MDCENLDLIEYCYSDEIYNISQKINELTNLQKINDISFNVFGEIIKFTWMYCKHNAIKLANNIDPFIYTTDEYIDYISEYIYKLGSITFQMVINQLKNKHARESLKIISNTICNEILLKFENKFPFVIEKIKTKTKIVF
jgi:hypothetical protein